MSDPAPAVWTEDRLRTLREEFGDAFAAAPC